MFQCSDPRVLIAVSLAFTKTTTHVAVGDRWAAGALLPPPDTSSSGHCQWMATFGPFLATMHRIERLHPSPSGMEWWTGWNFVTYRMFTISTAGFCSSSISVKTCERSYFYRDIILSHNSTFCRFSATIKPEKSLRPNSESSFFKHKLRCLGFFVWKPFLLSDVPKVWFPSVPWELLD